jgi:glucose-1-phosphate thymidylyltransferase
VLACARADDELCHIAGSGCPYTLPIAGRPLVSHALKALCDAGADEVTIVVDASIFEDVVAAVGDPPVEVHFVVQPDAASQASALEAAAELVGSGPVLVHLADSFSPRGLGRIEPGHDLLLTAGGRVVAGALAEVPGEPQGLTLASAVATADSVELEGGWRYDGTVDGVLAANQAALDEMKRGRVGADLSKAEVQGRVSIHPSAVLDGAKLRGPVYVGPGAVLVETYVGPYTTIAADVRLEGVEIEHSIVLPSATIRYPGHRIEASLVGEGARVGRDFSLPSAIRLRVGRGADILLG